jgi:hypothetical protein
MLRSSARPAATAVRRPRRSDLLKGRLDIVVKRLNRRRSSGEDGAGRESHGHRAAEEPE